MDIRNEDMIGGFVEINKITLLIRPQVKLGFSHKAHNLDTTISFYLGAGGGCYTMEYDPTHKFIKRI
jgi:hypothetical protein